MFETFAKTNDEEEEEAPEEPDFASSANAKVPARAPRKAAQTARFASSISRLARERKKERERERDMKIYCLAFDLEMCFFPCSANFGVSKKKEKKRKGKKFSQISHARELHKERERERVLKLRALHTTRALFVALSARELLHHPACLFLSRRSRERGRERLLNFSGRFPIFEILFFCGEEERERERKKGCLE